MTYIHVDEPADLGSLERALAGASRFALDCEAAGFHRYSDRLCLVQFTVGPDTFVVDPFGVDPSGSLRVPLEDPAVEIVMHGADFDLRLLSRDLDIELRGVFDTQIAATLLGEPSVGLAALLESRLGVKLSKKHQRADWARRPLTDEMLEYAANDTRHLLELADLLSADLHAKGREAWVEEECRVLEATAGSVDANEEPEDPVTRVKGARGLSPREVTALRETLGWRDRLARQHDRAPFRVVGDRALLDTVSSRPRDTEGLLSLKGFPRGLARRNGKELLEILRRVEALDDRELVPYPPPVRRGPGRPPPEVEARLDLLKSVRNARADELGLDRGALLPNATLLAVAARAPATGEELRAVDGVRAWQADVIGPDLLRTLAKRR